MRGIIIATMIEAAPFIKRLKLIPDEGHPFRVFRQGDDSLIITGIGKANCAMGTAYAAVALSIETACNCGAAGALKNGFPIGEIYTVQKIFEPDRPVLGSGNIRSMSAAPIEGLGIAVLSTMDRPVIGSEERRIYSETADLADMEGAAFVQACKRFGVKSYLLKIVTDIPGSEESAIIENIKFYGARLADFYAHLYNI